MSITNRQKEILAIAERLTSDRANLLGDGYTISEPFGKNRHMPLNKVMRNPPVIDDAYGLDGPNYDDFPVEGAIGTRHILTRLHSYLPSGLNGPQSIQSFLTISAAPTSNGVEDINDVRVIPLINPEFSISKANAAEPDVFKRGFALALYPAKSTSGVGTPLAADTTKGPISPLADPSAGPPSVLEPGANDSGFWTVDYDAGIVRFSTPPLNGPQGVMNPNNVYGDINGNETLDAYGAITMFATFYQYTGAFGFGINTQFVTVGDGYISDGIFTGDDHNTLQAAIDSVLDIGGGTVFVKEGNYTYEGSVEIPQDVHVIGMKEALISKSPQHSAFIFVGSNSSLEGFTIDNNASNSEPAIKLSSLSNSFTLENINIKNVRIDFDLDAYVDSYGIGFAPAHYNVTYKNIVIKDSFFNADSNKPTFIGAMDAGDAYTSYMQLDICNNNFGIQPATAIEFSGPKIRSMNYCKIRDNISAGKADIVFRIDSSLVSNSNIYNNIMPTSNLILHGLGFVFVNFNNNEFARLNFESNNGMPLSSSSNVTFTENIFNDQSGMYGKLSNIDFSNNKFLGQFSIYGTSWTTRSYAGGLDYQSVAYDGNGTWVTVGRGEFSPGQSYLASSDDGINWYRRPIPPLGSIFDVAHDQNKLWVMVGAGGDIFTSFDSVNWITQVSGTSSQLNAVAYDGYSKWMAVGASGRVITSPNAEDWTTQTSGTAQSLNDVAYADGYDWVAVGNASGGFGTIITSPDGITWTPRTTGVPNVNLNAVTYNPILRLWVVVGASGTILTSPDRITWTSNSSGTSQTLNEVAYDTNGLLLVVGNDGTLLRSLEAHTWTPVPITKVDDILGIAYGDGQWTLVGTWQDIFISSDTANWTEIENKGVYTGFFNAIPAYDGRGRWIVPATGGVIVISDDGGRTWITKANAAGTIQQLRGIAHDQQNTWVAAGNSGTIRTSPNGDVWTGRTSGTSATFRGVAYDGYSQWIAVGDASGGFGTIDTSPDGFTWTLQTAGVANANLNAAAAGQFPSAVKWVVVGASGTILTSDNGTSWANRTGITSNTLSGVVYSPFINLWIAVGSSGTIITSSDGVVWSIQASNTTASLTGVAVDHKGLITIAGGRITLTSTDGISWSIRDVSVESQSGGVGAIAHDKKGLWVGATSSGGRGGIFVSYDPTENITHSNITISKNTIQRFMVLVDDTGNEYSISNNLIGDFETTGRLFNSELIGNDVTDPLLSAAAPRLASFDSSIIANNDFNSTITIVSGANIKGTSWIGNKVSGFSCSGTITDSTFTDGYITSVSTFSASITGSSFDNNRFISNPTFSSDFVNSKFTNNRMTSSGTTSFASLEDSIIDNNHFSTLSITGLSRDSVFTDNILSADFTVFNSINNNFANNIVKGNLTITSQTNTNLVANRTANDGYGAVLRGIASGGGVMGFGGNLGGLGVLGIGGSSGLNNTVQGGGIGVQGIGDAYGHAYEYGIGVKGIGKTGGKFTGNDTAYVAVGISAGSTAILTSINGTEWMQRTVPLIGQLSSIAYNGRDLFVAVASPTTGILTSSDGINWLQRGTTGAGSAALNAVAYNDKDLWVAVGNGNVILTSPDGATWTRRQSSFHGNALITGVAHNKKDLWVAVGFVSGKSVGTSPDGINWTNRPTPLDALGAIPSDVAHDGKNTWVITCTTGQIITSQDGINWALQNDSFSGTAINAVAHNQKNLWVAVGSSGKIATSANGITWIQRNNSFGAAELISSVIYDGTKWIAVSSTSGSIATSPDGVTWTQRATGTIIINDLAAIYGSNAGVIGHGSQFNGTGIQGLGHGTFGIGVEGFGGDGYGFGIKGVGGSAGGTGIVGYGGGKDGYGILGIGSSDGYGGSIGVVGIGGKNSAGILGQGSGLGAGVVGMGGDAYEAGGYGGEFTGGFNKDGVYAVGGSNTVAGVKSIGGGTILIAGANNGLLATSLDGGNTWTQRNSKISGDISGIAYNGKDLWVAFGFIPDGVITSRDGINWNIGTLPGGTQSIAKVAHNRKDLWVAGGFTSNQILTSVDGISWITRAFTTGAINDIVYGKDKWIFASINNTVRISFDGITWTANTVGFGGSDDVTGVGYNGKDLWVVVGELGQLSTAPDTFSTTLVWTPRTSSFGTTLINKVAHNGKDLWVAVGNSGKLAISQDGITWSQQTSTFGSANITDINYDGQKWIAAGADGAIASSIDGITWNRNTNTSFDGISINTIVSGYGSNAGIVGYGSSYHGSGIQGIGGGYLGAGVEGWGGDGYGTGVKGIGGAAGGDGIEGHGGSSIALGEPGTSGYGGAGVRGLGGTADGYGGIFSGGTPNGSGVLALGVGTGIGLVAMGGSTGYGIVADGNNTRAPLKLMPQNPAPTSAGAGDFYTNSFTGRPLTHDGYKWNDILVKDYVSVAFNQQLNSTSTSFPAASILIPPFILAGKTLHVRGGVQLTSYTSGTVTVSLTFYNSTLISIDFPTPAAGHRAIVDAMLTFRNTGPTATIGYSAFATAGSTTANPDMRIESTILSLDTSTYNPLKLRVTFSGTATVTLIDFVVTGG